MSNSNSNALLLQAKSPIVEELQDHMTGLQQHRGQVASDNGRGNDLEEMAPAEAAVQAALGVLSRYTAKFTGALAFCRSLYLQLPLCQKQLKVLVCILFALYLAIAPESTCSIHQLDVVIGRDVYCLGMSMWLCILQSWQFVDSCKLALLCVLGNSLFVVSLLDIPLMLYCALAGEAQKLLQQLQLSALLTVLRQIC